MRIIASILLLLSIVLLSVTAARSFYQAKEEAVLARVKAGDFSDVASDLTDEATRAKERAASTAHLDTSARRGQLKLGACAAAAAVCALVGLVLIILRRRPRVAVGLVVASAVIALFRALAHARPTLTLPFAATILLLFAANLVNASRRADAQSPPPGPPR